MIKRILALTWLTLKAALRYRLVVVLAGVLLAAVVLLPLVIKDDGTARGFTQILLTYTLTAITALLGFATLWLGCGTMARDIEECQMQMVVVKPIARWEIWIGKWLGIMTLNLLLLALAGGAVFFLLQWRAKKLSPQEQAILFNEVLVARQGIREEIPNLEGDIEEVFQERLKQSSIAPTEYELLRQQVREYVKAGHQLMPSGYGLPLEINLGSRKDRLRDQPLYLRVKFAAAGIDMASLSAPKSFITLWQIGPPTSAKVWRTRKSLAAEAFHEFEIPPNLFDENGILTIVCSNPNETALLFQFEDRLEVLYREGGFALNFFRGLGIIFCWLSLLAAIGLAAASFLSFPVAAFFSIGILVVGLSGRTVSQVVEEGGVFGVNHETGLVDSPGMLNQIAVPIFQGLQHVIRLVEGFSPIDSLSTGRSITWTQLIRAFVQIALFMGGIFGVAGIYGFNRRELATAQSQT